LGRRHSDNSIAGLKGLSVTAGAEARLLA
jgi:hypothetical protein